MERLIATNTVAVGKGDVAPTTGTPGQATNGNPATGAPSTIFPAYGWNMLSEEIRAVIVAAGITPSSTDWGQMLEAMNALYRSGRFIGRQFFVNSGSYTPTAGTGLIKVRMIGGGGGGGGAVPVGSTSSAAGAGGASGGYIEFDLAIGGLSTPIPITIGSGGLGQNGASGLTGGTTTFGTLGSALYAACGGGAGASVGPAVAAGGGAQVGASFGGTCSFAGVLAVIAKVGNGGYNGIVFPNGASSTPVNVPGIGANSDFGSGGGNSNAGNGGNATGYGAGGGGGGSSPPSPGAQAGGNGSQGYILIEEFSA